eukprot:2877578-Rhodomonas_salina.1
MSTKTSNPVVGSPPQVPNLSIYVGDATSYRRKRTLQQRPVNQTDIYMPERELTVSKVFQARISMILNSNRLQEVEDQMMLVFSEVMNLVQCNPDDEVKIKRRTQRCALTVYASDDCLVARVAGRRGR